MQVLLFEPDNLKGSPSSAAQMRQPLIYVIRESFILLKRLRCTSGCGRVASISAGDFQSIHNLLSLPSSGNRLSALAAAAKVRETHACAQMKAQIRCFGVVSKGCSRGTKGTTRIYHESASSTYILLGRKVAKLIVSGWHWVLQSTYPYKPVSDDVSRL